MPVRDAAICKAILDESAVLGGETSSAISTVNALKDNIVLGTVQEGSEGNKWTQDVLDLVKEATEANRKFKRRARKLCNSQPVQSPSRA